MGPVLHLVRRLRERSRSGEVPAGMRLRTFQAPEDVVAWLELRTRAFRDESPCVGPWREEDFAREFLDKPWWSPERCWVVESVPRGMERRLLAAVTLARRGEGACAMPVIHWLMVDPQSRRSGLGRLLITTLEQAAWDAGDRQIGVETASAWRRATSLYEACGYKVDGHDL